MTLPATAAPLLAAPAGAAVSVFAPAGAAVSVSTPAGPAVPVFAPPPLLPDLATHAWAYPALESAHLLGIALLVGSLAVLDLRLWGLGASLAPRALARLALPLALAGFALAAATGLLMFASQPQELLANRAFTLKMGLLMLAGLNAAAFHARDGLGRLDAVARLQALASVLIWAGMIALGRWIAYL